VPRGCLGQHSVDSFRTPPSRHHQPVHVRAHAALNDSPCSAESFAPSRRPASSAPSGPICSPVNVKTTTPLAHSHLLLRASSEGERGARLVTHQLQNQQSHPAALPPSSIHTAANRR